MAQSAQIQKISPQHEAMINWLIENPTASRPQMAAVFGVTTAWLSTVIHSDAFQAKLLSRQDTVFNAAIVRPIQERLMGCAQVATDRLYERLNLEDDTAVILRSVEVLTKAVGQFKGEQQKQSAVSALVQQNNFNFGSISREDLATARQLVGSVKTATLKVEDAIEVEGDDISALPAGGGHSMGEDNPKAALLYLDKDEESEVPERVEVREESRGEDQFAFSF